MSGRSALPPCATSARDRDDSQLGTAAPTLRWLLIEHPGGWATAALDSAGFDPGVADVLRRSAVEVGGRVLLIRRTGRQPERDLVTGPLRWEVIDHDTGRALQGVWRDSADLLTAAAVLRAGPPAAEVRPQPLLLVCTHGRHDVCCAVRGRPVAAALAARWPEHTWECSHVGGDRFAANLLVVPDGTVYGSLDPATAVEVVERHLAGSVDQTHLRGFSAHPPVVQAALAGVLRELGPGAATDVRPDGVTQMDGQHWRVQVRGTGLLPERTVVTVTRTVQPPARLSCRAAADSAAYVYAAQVVEDRR